MGEAQWDFAPTAPGSVLVIFPSRAVPFSRTTNLWSWTACNSISDRGKRISRSKSSRCSQMCVGIRPALRSIIAPSSSTVQKLPRANTSVGSGTRPIPSASNTPLPILKEIGSRPNSARWAGPLPGVTPGNTGVSIPVAPWEARPSRFGWLAYSSSVL